MHGEGQFARAIVSLFDMPGLTFSARALATACLGELVENLQTRMCGYYYGNFNGSMR
jgi:hypothetical protein